LCSGRFVNNGKLSNGSLSLKQFADGCIVVPVQPGESNIIFSFIVENDSPVKITDLEMGVGFPKGRKYGLDSTKWHEAKQHLIIPGWKIDLIDLQSWCAQSPYPLFPSDSLTFPPITNFSVPLYGDPLSENGFFELNVRATGFENLFAANLIFFPVTSNSFKPFVAHLEQQGTNGPFRMSITPKELEDSQK